MARQRLMAGATINPKRLKRRWDSDGYSMAAQKLRRVRMTPWTTPKVMRMA
jgi:hypothetical protein